MAFELVRSRKSARDLSLIFDHLVRSYTSLGEPQSNALAHAVERIKVIEADMLALARLPHQGTIHVGPQLENLRYVTKKNVVFYFQADDARQIVRIVAIFFGGQDHRRHMIERLRQSGEDGQPTRIP